MAAITVVGIVVFLSFREHGRGSEDWLVVTEDWKPARVGQVSSTKVYTRVELSNLHRVIARCHSQGTRTVHYPFLTQKNGTLRAPRLRSCTLLLVSPRPVHRCRHSADGPVQNESAKLESLHLRWEQTSHLHGSLWFVEEARRLKGILPNATNRIEKMTLGQAWPRY